MQGDAVVFVLDPLTLRIGELQRFAGQLQVGEVGRPFQALRIQVGQLLQLSARVHAVVVLIEALDLGHRVHLIECPRMLQTHECPLVVEHRGLEADEQMRMRVRRKAG